MVVEDELTNFIVAYVGAANIDAEEQREEVVEGLGAIENDDDTISEIRLEDLSNS